MQVVEQGAGSFEQRAQVVMGDQAGSKLKGIIALLPQGRCHRPWWQDFVEPYRDGRGSARWVNVQTFYPPERFTYGHPGNAAAKGVPEPNFGSVNLVWRR